MIIYKHGLSNIKQLGKKLLCTHKPYGVENFYTPEKITLEKILIKSPYHIFKNWFKEADSCPDVVNPSVMCLATASKNGVPSARYMLCDSHSLNGFVFYTYHNSRKGEDLRNNPFAALAFFWTPLLKAVRIEGHVEQLSVEDSDKRFDSRSYPSQVDIHCSTQSKPIESMSVLDEREKNVRNLYDPVKVPRPQYFGWYIVKPTYMEFWQIHNRKERMRFRKPKEGELPDGKLTHQAENGWLYELMEP